MVWHTEVKTKNNVYACVYSIKNRFESKIEFESIRDPKNHKS